MAAIKEIEVRVRSATNRVEIAGGMPGEKGDTGDPGIIVSATPPPDPEENDLWLDIS